MIKDCDALLCFVDGQSFRWMRLLKPGFRHCFAAVRQDGLWTVINPAAAGIEVRVETHADLAGFYRSHGAVVVELRRRPIVGAAYPWAPLTCVEVCKRVVGIRSRRAVTPWLLYKIALQEKEKNPLLSFLMRVFGGNASRAKTGAANSRLSGS